MNLIQLRIERLATAAAQHCCRAQHGAAPRSADALRAAIRASKAAVAAAVAVRALDAANAAGDETGARQQAQALTALTREAESAAIAACDATEGARHCLCPHCRGRV